MDVFIWILMIATLLPSVLSVTFEETPSEHHEDVQIKSDEGDKLQQQNRTRQGKDLFDWIGLGTGSHVDPYLARINQGCLNGDLAECFKSRAINSFSEFFDKPEYSVNNNIQIIRMGRDVVQSVNREPYEYSTSARSDDSEWDQLVKFVMRKAERFIKTVAIKIQVPSELTGENEVYAPRFLDEIADEIDVLENKKDTIFSRNQLKKILIPMLIILKLFKLKLLLFLPLILGLASFKKFLGFLAIVIPGIIGFFKFCKPLMNNYQPPVYSQSGIGFPHYKESSNHNHGYAIENVEYNQEPHNYQSPYHPGNGQELAYEAYKPYK